MQEQREYYAFISYKREDEKWAKWLQHKLEHYKLPSNLNGRTDLPREIRPVFRDTSELNPGNLPQQIHDALAASKHLIVICSPRSAQSEWVNKEVEAFIKMDKRDCIIPFIIDGYPYAEDVAKECFPPAIRNLPKEKELLGANITEMGRDAAFIKAVAKMFGLRFDTLWQRHEREKKRHRIWIVALVVLFIFFMLGIVAYYKLLSNKISRANEELKEQIEIIKNQGDSIISQYNIIYNQQDSIRRVNLALNEEKDNLIISNRQRLINESKALVELAVKKCDEGDFVSGRRLALKALPRNLSAPDRPFIVEAEAALRRSFERNPFAKRSIKPMSDAISPNGNYIAHAWADGIDIIDANTNEQLYFWEYVHSQDSPLSMVSYNKDGTALLFPSWRGAILADSRTGQVIDTFSNTGFLEMAQYSRDYTKVLTSGGEGLIVYDAVKKDVLYRDVYRYAIFHPVDNNKIITLEEYDVYVIDMTSGKREEYNISDCSIKSIDMHPNGRYIAYDTYGDHKLVVWDVSSGKIISTVAEKNVEEFAFSADGKYLYMKNSTGKESFFDTQSWREYDFDAPSSLATDMEPFQYADVKKSYDIIPVNIHSKACYKKDQITLPKEIVSALTNKVFRTLYITGIIQSNTGVCIVAYSDEDANYDNYGDYGAVFKNGRLIRTFEVEFGEDDRLSGGYNFFLNYDGKYYGYEDDAGISHLFETKSGRFIRLFSERPVVVDKYAITINVSNKDNEMCDINIIDIKSGTVVQRYMDFPACYYDVSVEVYEKKIYVTGGDTKLCFSIRPLQDLIDDAARQFRQYGRRRTISYNYTPRDDD